MNSTHRFQTGLQKLSSMLPPHLTTTPCQLEWQSKATLPHQNPTTLYQEAWTPNAWCQRMMSSSQKSSTVHHSALSLPGECHTRWAPAVTVKQHNTPNQFHPPPQTIHATKPIKPTFPKTSCNQTTNARPTPLHKPIHTHAKLARSSSHKPLATLNPRHSGIQMNPALTITKNTKLMAYLQIKH